MRAALNTNKYNIAVADQSYEGAEALKDEHYQFLLKVSSDAIVVHRDGLIILVNEAASRLFEAVDAEQLLGKPITNFIRTRRRNVVEGQITSKAITSRSKAFMKCKLTRCDGIHFDAEIAASVIGQNNSKTIQLVARRIVEHPQPEYHLSYLAQFDLLTQLPNRSQFRDRLRGAMSRANRNKQLIAILFIGIDQFKKLNTALGQTTGDLVLKQLAGKLKRCVRESDTVARLGGDEFSLILEGLVEKEGSLVVAKRLQDELSLPISINDETITISASIGIATYPESAADLDQLWRFADVALYYAKGNGGNNYELYAPEIEHLSHRDELRRTETKQKLASLTAREREVLDMLMTGKANKMIAYLLGTSTRTIENHRAKIMDKMEVDSLPELVRITLDLNK